MEKEVIITRRFRSHTLRIYQHLLRNFPAKIAYIFLEKIEDRIGLISRQPTIGKQSLKNESVRSIPLIPYNLIFYRIKKDRIEILCLFDTRRNSLKKPY